MRSGQLERAKASQWEGLSEGWPVSENTSKGIPQAGSREMLAACRRHEQWSNRNSARNRLVNLLISFEVGSSGLASCLTQELVPRSLPPRSQSPVHGL